MTDIADRDFVLSDGERINPLWFKLKERLETMLADRRKRNDSPKLDPTQTAALRGEINLLKAILAYGDAPPILDGNSYRRTETRAGTVRM